MSDTNTQTNGIGFFGLLTILFIGLKLTNHIDWSWWVVFAPLWGPPVVVIAVIGVLAAVIWALDK